MRNGDTRSGTALCSTLFHSLRNDDLRGPDPQFTGDLHVGHGHDDLAFGAALFQLGDRLGDAFEGAVEDRLEFARVHKARQFRQVRSNSFLKLAASLSGFQSQL